MTYRLLLQKKKIFKNMHTALTYRTKRKENKQKSRRKKEAFCLFWFRLSVLALFWNKNLREKGLLLKVGLLKI